MRASYKTSSLRSFSSLLTREFHLGRVVSQNAMAQAYYEEDQKSMQKTVRKIIDDDINPYVDEWEASGQYPAKQIFRKLGDAGLLGVNKPVEYGGMGLDFKFSVALNEELGHIKCGGIPMSIAVQTDMSTPALARFGSEYLKKEFLQPSIHGDVVSCLGVSEPGGGSDVAALQTTAKRVGDDLVINGQKMWITNAFQADWMCLLANTQEGPGTVQAQLLTRQSYMVCSSSPQQVLDLCPYEHPWYPPGKEAGQAWHEVI